MRLQKHALRRLPEGRSIGSGAVEGAAKNLIGRRLKQTGARWRVRRVNRMATLCSAFYSDHWDAYWDFVQNWLPESKRAPSANMFDRRHRRDSI